MACQHDPISLPGILYHRVYYTNGGPGYIIPSGILYIGGSVTVYYTSRYIIRHNAGQGIIYRLVYYIAAFAVHWYIIRWDLICQRVFRQVYYTARYFARYIIPPGIPRGILYLGGSVTVYYTYWYNIPRWVLLHRR